jgi:hypothetical protein
VRAGASALVERREVSFNNRQNRSHKTGQLGVSIDGQAICVQANDGVYEEYFLSPFSLLFFFNSLSISVKLHFDDKQA